MFFPGGRFKKEVIIDGHSYLLLIRDEGGSPEMQVSEPYPPMRDIIRFHIFSLFHNFYR